MPSLTEAPGTLGSLTVPFKVRDPALEAELVDSEGRPRLRHLRLQWGEEQLGIFVLTRAIPGDPFVMKGRNMAWWLGDQNRGPLIADRRYCAGTNKLSNGGFEQDDLHWSTPEDSKWSVPDTDAAFSGTNGAETTADYEADDVLTSEESFEVVVGDSMRAKVRARRPSGSVGRLRLRTVYAGRFKHSELLGNSGFESGDDGTWTLPADSVSIINDAKSRTGSWHLEFGNIPKPRLDTNGGFETGDFTGWAGPTGWVVQDVVKRNGTYAAERDGDTSPATAVRLSGDDISVNRQDLYVVRLSVRRNSAMDAGLYLFIGSETATERQEIKLVDADVDPDIWHTIEEEFRVPDEEHWDTLSVNIENRTTASGLPAGSSWFVDDVEVWKFSGNRRQVSQGGISVIPEQRYKLSAFIRADASLAEFFDGRVWFSAKLTGAGRTAQILESPDFRQPDDDEGYHQFSWEFEPPSGYDTLELRINAEDITAGAFRVDDVSLKLADPTTHITDEVIGPTQSSWAEFTSNTTVPTGAQEAHLELVAEDQGDGWQVDEASFQRVCTAVAATDVVSDLLQDNDGNQLVPEGTLHDAGTIAYDWTVENAFNLDALNDLSREGFVAPKREWRINADGELDWGLPSEVFADRTTFVLTEDDVLLDSQPDIERDAEEFSTTVKLIGTERTDTRGRRKLITGKATNDDLGLTDYFGNPIDRTHLVEDGSINHHDFADARASDVASDDSSPSEMLDLGLRDWRALGLFDLGDWIYVYLPDDNIEDSANEMSWQGQTIYPAKLRVLERDWTLGNGPFRAWLRRSAGDEIEVTEDILWPSQTSARITVGDPHPDFATSPHGGGAYAQYKRFRLHNPRD